MNLYSRTDALILELLNWSDGCEIESHTLVNK